MKVDRAQLADVCKRYGVFLRGLPAGIDGPGLLWAIAGNESSFGANTAPRHEIEYCPLKEWHKQYSADAKEGWVLRSGKYSSDPRQAGEYKDFGCLACCSFTPWQIMSLNAIGYTPIELMQDLEKGAEAVVAFLNREILVRQPQNLLHFACIWNGLTSEQYIADLKRNYAAGLPA